MSLVRFLAALAVGTIASWIAWVLVLTTIDPISGGTAGLLLFFGSFFLATVGTVALIGFFLRYWLEKEKILFRQIAIALRQAFLIGTGATVALMLQGTRWLTWWSTILLVVLILIIEMFFLAEQSRRPR